MMILKVGSIFVSKPKTKSKQKAFFPTVVIFWKNVVWHEGYSKQDAKFLNILGSSDW